MRFQEIKESLDQQEIITYSDADHPKKILESGKKMAEKIRTECAPWLDESQGQPIFRGVSGSYHANWLAYQKKTRDNRRPLSSSSAFHEIMNLFIQIAGGTANRTNSLFVSGSFKQAASYGEIFQIFPQGEFSYTWSPHMRDWYTRIQERIGSYLQTVPQEIVKAAQQKYQSDLTLAKTLGDYQDEDHMEKNAESIIKNNAKYTIVKMLSSLSRREPFELPPRETLMDPDLYDKEEIQKDIFVNRDLDKAIQSNHEIMVQCNSAIYIDSAFYGRVVKPILLGREPEIDPGSTPFKDWIDPSRYEIS